MAKMYEVKTIKDGQQDIYNVEGDYISSISDNLGVYVKNEGSEVLVALFQSWVYARECSMSQEEEASAF